MIIPDSIDPNCSRGEQILLHKFKTETSSFDFYVLHSLFISKHLKTVSGELDILVLAPGKGIFSLEVKHGNVRRENGLWYFENRLGKVNTSAKGPFRQVSDTMHSLRTWLLEKTDLDKKLKERLPGLLFGYGVVFSGLDEIPVLGTEGEAWMVYTRDLIRRSPVSYYIENLSRNWREKMKNCFCFHPDRSLPSKEDCEKIFRLLRGDFNYRYTDINKIVDAEYHIEEFTKEQFDILNFTEYNARCLFEGAAGTGKTILASELAARKIREGKKVAFFCFNRALGEKLSEDIAILSNEKNGNYFAGSFHSYLQSHSNLKVPLDDEEKKQYFNETLPLDFLLSHDFPEQEKFDVLIIDEAQDLLTLNFLEVFDAVLKSGLNNGNWYFFGDFSRQAIFLNNPTETLKNLKSRAFFAVYPKLTINCRNTLRICRQNTLLTGAELPQASKFTMEGEGIETMFPAKGIISGLESVVGKLMERSIDLKKLTVLSPRSLKTTGLYQSKVFTQNKIAFSTIQAFKGLENTIIVLTGFDDLETEENQRLLYVGISRARLKLYILLDRKLEMSYNNLIRNNINKL